MGINFFYWEQYKNVIYSPPKFSRHEIILLSVGTDGLFYTLCALCSAHQHTILVSSYLSYVISTMVFKDTLSSLSLFDGTSAQCISIIPYCHILTLTVTPFCLSHCKFKHFEMDSCCTWMICPNLLRIFYSHSARHLWISLKNDWQQQQNNHKIFPFGLDTLSLWWPSKVEDFHFSLSIYQPIHSADFPF